MAKLGVVRTAARGRADGPRVDVVAQPGRIETPLAETERRTGGAPATAPAGPLAPARGGYRRVFACATASSDSPDEHQ